MSLEILKKEIESALMITKWSPSTEELAEIAERLKNFKGEATKSNIAKIVLDVVDSYECIALEGVDNSDLTTLLLLATKTITK
jgi:hypothetical protein